VDLAFGGRGVARRSGMVIFVPGALPGESVRARVSKVRKTYGEASVMEVLRPSVDRVPPPCSHYGACGGCDLQHMKPAAQASAKGSQVRTILERVGGIQAPPVEETRVGGEPWAYRFRMDFEWTTDRRGPRLGLHRRGSAREIVPIDRCHLVSDTVNAIAAWLGEEARTRRLASWDPARHRGLLRRTGIQEARGTGEILISLATGRGDPPALVSLARDLLRRFPRVVGVAREEIDRRGLAAGESILAGRDYLVAVVDGDRFMVPSDAFFQPNATACATLRRAVIEAISNGADATILELYCGVGFFTLALARHAGSVVAVEGSRRACAAARANASAARLTNCRFIHGDVQEVLARAVDETRPDVIVLDPPRTGLPRGVTLALAASGVPRLVYVSCDPATLARDLKMLAAEGGIRVESVVPIDLFPQTHHVECVARLRRS
jgi:23S rRNA (uracil1939-C5)-methyltransferase